MTQNNFSQGFTTNPDNAGINKNPLEIYLDLSSLDITGSINTESNKFNKTCKIINGYNFETLTYDPNNIFGVQGLPAFNHAEKKINNRNLTKNQLYSLYVNKNIKKLTDISYGINYSDISNAPIDRESLDCSINNTSDINVVINKDNFKLFTNLKYVASKYPNLLNIQANAESGLRKHNQIVLNNYLYNNIFPNLNKKKEYSYFANNRNKNIKRIIPSSFQKNIKYNPLPPPNYVMSFKKC